MHQHFRTRGDQDKSGAEAFVVQDRVLVRRTMGAKHRGLVGGCDVFPADPPEYQSGGYGPMRRIASR
jgi:hypothetical protein